VHDHDGLDTMAASATLHCLSGWAVGEIAGKPVLSAVWRRNLDRLRAYVVDPSG
jgi:hypothetical protein